MKKTEMGRACSTYGERRDACRVLVGHLRKGDFLENQGVDGRIILKWILEKLNGVMDWIDLAQDRIGWRDFVNTVKNLRIP
jgi:hypothetical protein